MKILKLILITGLTLTTYVNASEKDDAALKAFIGVKNTTINNSYVCTPKVSTKITKPKKHYVKKHHKKRYSKLKTTYFINYKRPGYRVVDNYKNYNFSDLSIDYKKQMAEENRKKDTL